MAIEIVLYLESFLVIPLNKMNKILQPAGHPLRLLTYAQTNVSMTLQANR